MITIDKRIFQYIVDWINFENNKHTLYWMQDYTFPSVLEQSTVEYEIEKIWNSSNTMQYIFISILIY